MTRRSPYLRDARHLDKYLYIIRPSSFYESYFTASYTPSKEYIAIVDELLTRSAVPWHTVREGVWCHVLPGHNSGADNAEPQIDLPRVPEQGWKIHVSGTVRNAHQVLFKTGTIAFQHNVPFKFAVDKTALTLLGSKRWPRGGSGKFITLYPPSLEDFRKLLEALYSALRTESGPYILSDRRYRDCTSLYYRYGGMRPVPTINILGERVHFLTSPSGLRTPDVRLPYFVLPEWVADPFPSPDPAPSELTLHGGRYHVTHALSFSNTGGVYLAQDQATDSTVVVKEARPHTAVADRGNDSVASLRHEWTLLGLLSDTGVTPRPIEWFQDWENFFLVEEYVDGVDVRRLMLTHSPLLRVAPSRGDSERCYAVFTNVLRQLAIAIEIVHRRGIVLGDLSPLNVLVAPTSYKVTLIDLEGAFRKDLDSPSYLFTPGFRDFLRVRKGVENFGDDHYSLAAIMLYLLFPIAALHAIKRDLYTTVVRQLVADLGWSRTQVFPIIRGLAEGTLSCTDVGTLLDMPVEILPPAYHDLLPDAWPATAAQDLGRFVLSSMSAGPNDATLFPADPFVHHTNPLSLGFGALGVLYALHRCGVEIPPQALDWLERQLDAHGAKDLAPGLLTGAAGIAWCLEEIGLADRASAFIHRANQSELLPQHHSYFYGRAGVGMANLFFWQRTGRSGYLDAAIALATSLLASAREDHRGIYWSDDRITHVGFGYGQSGVALFLLRLFEVIQDRRFLDAGRRALAFDLSHGVSVENGVLSFPRATNDVATLVHYIEEGTAGILKVALRYGLTDTHVSMMLADMYRKYAVLPGLMFGLSGFVDTLVDSFMISGQQEALPRAKRAMAGIREIFLIDDAGGVAVPGEGLYRISCDYATGVAGVMRTLHRFAHLQCADFMLDELARPRVAHSLPSADAVAPTVH